MVHRATTPPAHGWRQVEETGTTTKEATHHPRRRGVNEYGPRRVAGRSSAHRYPPLGGNYTVLCASCYSASSGSHPRHPRGTSGESICRCGTSSRQDSRWGCQPLQGPLQSGSGGRGSPSYSRRPFADRVRGEQPRCGSFVWLPRRRFRVAILTGFAVGDVICGPREGEMFSVVGDGGWSF